LKDEGPVFRCFASLITTPQSGKENALLNESAETTWSLATYCSTKRKLSTVMAICANLALFSLALYYTEMGRELGRSHHMHDDVLSLVLDN